jgi:hypothetical protein
MLPGGFENEVVLSDEFYHEILEHPIPADLEAAKALSCSPAALDLFMWLSYRCVTAQGRSGFLSSVISVSQISWAAPNTLAHAGFESGWTSGWTWSGAVARLPGQNQFGWQLYPNHPSIGCRRGAEIDGLISIRTGVFSRRRISLADMTQRFPRT